MRKGTASDEQLITDIISASFADNPSVNEVVKNDGKKDQRITALARYAFRTALRRNGIYISSDEKGVAICYDIREKKESLADFFDQLKLVQKAIGWSRVIKVLKREAYLKNIRPKKDNYLYFWFFGVIKEGRGHLAAWELKEEIFKEANRRQLPIYLETSIEQNKRVYERYGFQVYHSWNTGDKTTLWFMKRS